jgi:hypothetical protein
MNTELPMPTKQGWRWERVYRGQTLTVETYREMGKTLSEAAPAVTAELSINGEHYEKHSDQSSPGLYCELGMNYLCFLVAQKSEDKK